MTEALAVDGWVLVTDDYPEFAQPVQAAESRFMQKLLDIAVKGAADDPKIDLAILERKFPKEWARPTTLKLNAPISCRSSWAAKDARWSQLIR